MTTTGSCSSGRPAANETGSHVRDAQLVSLVVLEMDHGRRRWNVKLRSVDEKRQSHRAAVERAAGDRGAVLIGAAGQALPDDVDTRAVVLVEGASDQLAVEALAARRGRDLDAEGVSVVSIGGAGNIGRFLQLFGPQGLAVRLAGLYDAAEERDFRRGLERAGFGSDLTRDDMEALGFYVCVADLEDELIRSLGATAVEHIIDAQGELRSFRTLQQQPAQQGRTIEQQLRRFMGTRGGRKIQYAPVLVEALDLTRVPRSLDRVLAHV